MPDKLSNATAVAQQIELAIGRLDSLLTLPCIAAQFISKLLHGQFSPSALADIIESDPALTARILSLIGRRGVSLPEGRFSLRQALDKLAAEDVRDAVLSVKVLQDAGLEGSGFFDLGEGPERDKIQPRKGLLLHSLAVACCAKDIAEAASPQMDSQLAYCAGLLHDIGKLALQETMPKSFARMVEEAESTKECLRAVEQKHIGTDHTIIGKHLAAKWQLPNLIILGIWLHHSETVIISQDLPEARIAAVVQLADSIARQSGIGWSGSYDLPEAVELIARWLSINSEQVQQIRRNLPEMVREKSRILGLDLPDAAARYCDIAAATIAKLARRQTELSLENRRLQSASSHLDFTTDFLLSINSAMGAVSIAEDFATRWQKFYQTGMVCLYLAPSIGQQAAALLQPAFEGSQMLEAVIVESLSQSKMVSLNAPAETSAIPKSIANNFAILNAHEHIDWLFEQLDVDFDAERTKLVPLLSAGRAIGAIAFELHYPGDVELFEERFKASTSIAAGVLDMALARQRQENFAERFVRLIGVAAEGVPSKAEEAESRRSSAGVVASPATARSFPSTARAFTETSGGPAKMGVSKAAIGSPAGDPLGALAEMAAGAAHELNNPLSVISGRAQLLAEGESDREKKQILEQIQANAQKASAIIDDLMSFAEPPQPRSARTKVRQIIDEAVELTCQKTNVEHIDVQIEVAEDVEDVFVDSAQIVSAIANVISNAVESYSGESGLTEGELGPIRITAEADESGEVVRLTISDQGCGMDAETLQKATQPFFSVRPAGRKRGMGLAYTARFVKLNKGSLDIESEPGSGTAVTICLPRK